MILLLFFLVFVTPFSFGASNDPKFYENAPGKSVNGDLWQTKGTTTTAGGQSLISKPGIRVESINYHIILRDTITFNSTKFNYHIKVSERDKRPRILSISRYKDESSCSPVEVYFNCMPTPPAKPEWLLHLDDLLMDDEYFYILLGLRENFVGFQFVKKNWTHDDYRVFFKERQVVSILPSVETPHLDQDRSQDLVKFLFRHVDSVLARQGKPAFAEEKKAPSYLEESHAQLQLKRPGPEKPVQPLPPEKRTNYRNPTVRRMTKRPNGCS